MNEDQQLNDLLKRTPEPLMAGFEFQRLMSLQLAFQYYDCLKLLDEVLGNLNEFGFKHLKAPANNPDRLLTREQLQLLTDVLRRASPGLFRIEGKILYDVTSRPRATILSFSQTGRLIRRFVGAPVGGKSAEHEDLAKTGAAGFMTGGAVVNRAIIRNMRIFSGPAV